MTNKTLLLAKTLFGRFFETELMPPGLPQVQLVIWSMALLASPGLLLPVEFATKYNRLSHTQPAVVLVRAMLVDRLLFITMTMTAIGLVALVIWDGIFPDRRDARILGMLPLPGRVLIGARLLALAALAGLFLAGINLIPSIVFGATIGAFGGARNVLLGIVAHITATTMAGVFVFSTLVALQGIVLNLGGRRTSERIAPLLQTLFVMALLQMVFFSPRMSGLLTQDLRSPWLAALPSAWFLGLYDVLGGKPVAGAVRLAGIGAFATFASTGLATLLFVGTHARLTRLAIESQEVSRPRRRVVVWMLETLTKIAAPHPISRAIFEFTVRSLARSRSHRLLVAAYTGVAAALVVSAIVPAILRSGISAFATPSASVLSAPLVLGFFLLVGARVGLAIPVEPRANWIFRLREPVDRAQAIAGVRAALMVVGVLPMVVVGAITVGLFWGPWLALVHAAFCALMGWLLVEILLIRFDKLPFTCTYFPGKSRIRLLWPIYLQGFIVYCYTSAAAEVELLKHPIGFIRVVLVISIAIVILTMRRQHRLKEILAFRFQEEDPASIFAGFHLSEGLAAVPQDDRRLR